MRIFAGLIAILAACASPGAQAGFVTNAGDPPDNGFLSDRVCCIDVAALNVLEFLARSKPAVRDALNPDPKAEQEAFHKTYDPDFSSPGAAGSADAVDGWRATLTAKGLTGDVKLFATRDLDYAALVKEWRDDEMIILMMSSPTGGHAVLLWGLDDDPQAAAPEIAIVDPNVHPNSRQPVEGAVVTGTGTSTRVPLTRGVDANGFPEWRITVPAGSHTYQLADGSAYDVEWAAKDYRISAFVSISDVGKIPAPGSGILLVSALGLAAFVVARGRRKEPRDDQATDMGSATVRSAIRVRRWPTTFFPDLVSRCGGSRTRAC